MLSRLHCAPWPQDSLSFHYAFFLTFYFCVSTFLLKSKLGKKKLLQVHRGDNAWWADEGVVLMTLDRGSLGPLRRFIWGGILLLPSKAGP